MRKRIKKQPFFSHNRSKTYTNLCKGRNAAVSAADFSIQHQWWISAVHHKYYYFLIKIMECNQEGIA